MQHDIANYLLGQIAQTTRSLESDMHEIKAQTAEMHGRLDRIRDSLEALTTMGQRLVLLAVLWTGAVGLNVAPDKLAEFVTILLQAKR